MFSLRGLDCRTNNVYLIKVCTNIYITSISAFYCIFCHTFVKEWLGYTHWPAALEKRTGSWLAVVRCTVGPVTMRRGSVEREDGRPKGMWRKRPGPSIMQRRAATSRQRYTAALFVRWKLARGKMEENRIDKLCLGDPGARPLAMFAESPGEMSISQRFHFTWVLQGSLSGQQSDPEGESCWWEQHR